MKDWLDGDETLAGPRAVALTQIQQLASRIFLVLIPLCTFLLIFFRPLFRDETFMERDLAAYYRPAKSLIHLLVESSSSYPPVWNPFFATGQPFAANPEHEILHPLTQLFLFIPFEWALRLQILLPVLFTLAASYWMLRVFGRSQWGALFGAMSWGLGGLVLSSTNLIPCLFVLAVLPAFLGCLIRLVRGPSLVNTASAAIWLGIIFLAGEPVTILCSGVVAGTLVVAESWRKKRFPWQALAVVFVLGLGIGLGTLLPGARHVLSTVRWGGLPQSTADSWSFPAVRILEFAIPWAAGHFERHDRLWFWAYHLYPGREFPFYFSVYANVLLPLLAFSAAFSRRFRLYWVALSFGFLASLGPAFLLWPFLRSFPGLSGIRYPEKFIAIPCFMLAVLASAGFDLVLARRRIRKTAAGLLFALSGFGVIGFIFLRTVPCARETAALLTRIDPSIEPHLLSTLSTDFARLALVAAVPAIALIALKRHRGLLAALLVTWAGLEAVQGGSKILRTRSIESVNQPPGFLRKLVQEPPSGPIFHLAEVLQRNRDDVDFMVALAVAPMPVRWRIPMTLEPDFDLTELAWSARASKRIWRVVAKRSDLLGPLLSRRGGSAVIIYSPKSPGVPTTLFLEDPKPLAFLAESARVLTPKERWESVVEELGPRVSGTVLFAAEDVLSEKLALPPSGGKVNIEKRLADQTRLRVWVEGPNPGILAFNQTWAKGWRASIDGTPARVLRCDLSLSAIVVPKGTHQIEIRYSDPTVTAGFWSTISSLLLCGGLIGVGVMRQKAGGNRLFNLFLE